MRAALQSALFLAFCSVISSACAQQQVPNGGFEFWEHSGENIEPKGWNSLMSADLCMFCSFAASQRVFRDKRTPSGNGNCIRIESTGALGGIIVNGSVTTGRVTAPSAIPSHGFNRTLKTDPEFSLRFTDKPDSLVFWARYSITDKSDSALVSFLIHDDVEMTDPTKFCAEKAPLATARKTFQTAAIWRRFSVPFSYSGKESNRAMYLLATFSSSARAGKGNSRSTLWIDDVELIYNNSADISGKQTASRTQLNLNR